MIARIAFWKLKDAKYPEFLKSMGESASILRKHKGIKGLAMFHSEKEADRAISVTFWETEQDSDTSRKDPSFQAAIKSMAHLFASEPEIKIYDVDGLELHMENFK